MDESPPEPNIVSAPYPIPVVVSQWSSHHTRLAVSGANRRALPGSLAKRGEDLATQLGVDLAQLEYVCRCLLDEMRMRGCLNREMLQVNAEIVWIAPVSEDVRFRCEVCGRVMAGAAAGMPCPRCHGTLVGMGDAELASSRTVQRIRAASLTQLVAAEHTAQVTTQVSFVGRNEFFS